MLIWVQAAGGRELAGPTVLVPLLLAVNNHAVSSSAARLPCEVVPSWLWEGGILARREVVHLKSVLDHW